MFTQRTDSTPLSRRHARPRRARLALVAGAFLLATVTLVPTGPAGAQPLPDPAAMPAIVTGIPDADRWAGSDEAMAAAATRRAELDAFLAGVAEQESADFLSDLDQALAHVALGRVGPVIDEAVAKLGRPYVYGAGGPGAFDCSGFTRWVWQQAGVDLPHYTGAQWAGVERIPVEQLQPGDLVFYWGRGGGDPSHVGLYVGDGQMIHAPGRGRTVRYESIWYWSGATVAAGRVR